MRWLAPYDYDMIRPLVPSSLAPLPTPPSEGASRRVKINETGGPLVEIPADIGAFHAYLRFESPKIPQRMLARQEVITRIREANAFLPNPFRLMVLDTWRSKEAQRELGRIYKEIYPNLDATFVADPDDTVLVAPHTLGAAVDLTLAVDEHPLPLGSDFDQFDETAASLYLETKVELTAQEELDRDLRRLLGSAMLRAGLAPLQSEWWHWSYGDQRWAAFTGHSETLFAQIDDHRR